MRGCAQVWEDVPFLNVGGCAPVWEGVLQCGRVCPNVRGCAPRWESVPQCRRVCPSVGRCAQVWEGVPQCGRVCPSVRGCALVSVMCACEVWVSLSHVLMMNTQMHLCVNLISGRFCHVAKAYVTETS